MVDEPFRAALFRDPVAVLGGFDLGAEERAAVLGAIAQSRDGTEGERGGALHAVLIRRWAT
jgi:hypothetical protein